MSYIDANQPQFLCATVTKELTPPTLNTVCKNEFYCHMRLCPGTRFTATRWPKNTVSFRISLAGLNDHVLGMHNFWLIWLTTFQGIQ